METEQQAHICGESSYYGRSFVSSFVDEACLELGREKEGGEDLVVGTALFESGSIRTIGALAIGTIFG